MDSIPYYLYELPWTSRIQRTHIQLTQMAMKFRFQIHNYLGFSQIWRWKRESEWKYPKTLSVRHWGGSDVWVTGGFTSNLRHFLRICLGSIQRQMVSHRSCLCIELKPRRCILSYSKHRAVIWLKSYVNLCDFWIWWCITYTMFTKV